jgi:small subunit ribosomal protein S16
MSVVIRMKRAGAKKRPFYRVVVADSRYARDGRYIEQLGYYDPLTDPAKFIIDAAKFEQWIRKGAKPSESVEVMMSKHAPAALRPAPLPRIAPAEPGAAAAAPKAAKVKKVKKAKAAPKATRKPRKTKASEKKAKTKAKAKARKASGVVKARKAKKKTKK